MVLSPEDRSRLIQEAPRYDPPPPSHPKPLVHEENARSNQDPPLPATGAVTLYCMVPLFILMLVCAGIVALYTTGCLTRDVHEILSCRMLTEGSSWIRPYIDHVRSLNGHTLT